MTSKENSLNWFEISVTDIKRAKKFYETIFEIEMYEMNMMDSLMAFFPAEPGNGKASGALVQSNLHTPSVAGAKIYLNANPDLAPVLARVESAGGSITIPKSGINGGEFGYMAFIIDSEGNEVALHSNK
ncbi:MAG: VOC family protein [Bacteroidota bacterium]